MSTLPERLRDAVLADAELVQRLISLLVPAYIDLHEKPSWDHEDNYYVTEMVYEQLLPVIDAESTQHERLEWLRSEVGQWADQCPCTNCQSISNHREGRS